MERHRNQRSFPHVAIRTADGRRAVEVTLLSQLDVGAGDAMAVTAGHRQTNHPHYNNANDEPSVRLSGPDLAADDPAALYTFSVGGNGHPFHRHAAPRLFTAISGSGGALLRFIPADLATARPHDAVAALRHVEIPADCLFTVRMAANTWHQFQPLRGNQHPALFAVSCHPDETAGELDPALLARVEQGNADLASLTELMPDATHAALRQHTIRVPTTTLGFDFAIGPAWRNEACSWLRHRIGKLRQALARRCHRRSHATHDLPTLRARSQSTLPDANLLAAHLPHHHHQDCVQLRIDQHWVGRQGNEQLLVALLQAFIQQPAGSVSNLMRLRNLLARPLGLRTSPLGCPVSSLLGNAPNRFAQRFGVLASRVDSASAQVLLGADDRHLRFRSSITIGRDGDQVVFTLSTRVHCSNLFGHLYMALVDPLHRHFIAPKMLKTAVGCVLQDIAVAEFSGLPAAGS